MITIVMPAHNEAGYLESAVKTVVTGGRNRGLDFEVVISENGSTDGTPDEAKQLARTFREVTVLRATEADYGEALKAGFLAARGRVVVNFDVDLVDLGFFDKATAIIAAGEATIVVGSKRGPGSHDERPFGRRAVTAVFSAVLRYGFGLRVSDTHGLKALLRPPLVPLVEACQFGGDIFDTELILRAERAGLLVRELPVTVTDQRPPRTPIAGRIPRTLVGLLRLRLALGRAGLPRSPRSG